MSLIKRKKKLKISPPSNFVHRVHTGFDSVNNQFVGLPAQWKSLVGSLPGTSSVRRPVPFADPRGITNTGALDLNQKTKTKGRQTSIVRSNSLRSPQTEGGGHKTSPEEETCPDSRQFYPGMEEFSGQQVRLRFQALSVKNSRPSPTRNVRLGTQGLRPGGLEYLLRPQNISARPRLSPDQKVPKSVELQLRHEQNLRQKTARSNGSSSPAQVKDERGEEKNGER